MGMGGGGYGQQQQYGGYPQQGYGGYPQQGYGGMMGGGMMGRPQRRQGGMGAGMSAFRPRDISMLTFRSLAGGAAALGAGG